MPTPQQIALEKLKSFGTLSDPIPGSALLTPSDMQGGDPISPGGSNPPDDGALDYLYQNNLKRELQNRAFTAARTGDQNEFGALRGMLGENEQDLASSPITQDIDAQHQAESQGFPNPQAAAEASRTAALQKILLPAQVKAQGDLAVEKEKNKGVQDLEQANFDRMTKMRGGQGSTPGQPQVNAPTPGQPGAANQPPTRSQSFMEFLTGNGAAPQNSAKDLASAAMEKLKYKFMATPFTPLAQENSFANLQQLAAQFPGVRGFSYLLPKLAEHQANWGSETPASTYLRAHDLDGMLSQTEQEFNDPSVGVTMGENGRIKMAQTPQMIQRGRLAIQDTHAKIKDMLHYMEQQYPGIEKTLQTKGGVPVTPGSGKQVLDEQGNLVSKVPR